MRFGLSSLRGSYWLTLVVTLLALSPEFILSAALGLVQPVIAGSFATPVVGVSWSSTMSTAALAFGAVIGADLAQRFRNRPLFLSYEGMFIVGSLLAALAPASWVYAVGHVLQGLSTGLLLVAALPPLVTTFPTHRLRTTIPAVVIGLFGAVTAGPLVGGYVAQTGVWRLLFGATGVLGLLTLVLALLVLAERPALNPDMRVDVPAFVLSILGTVLAFYGVGKLMSHPWNSPQVYVPVVLGALMLAALIIVEARQSESLMPATPLSTTFPIMGILSAIIAGAAFTSLLSLTILFLQRVQGLDPLTTGIMFWPTLATGIIGALLVGTFLTTRWVLALPLFGMLALTVAAYLLTDLTPATPTGEILWISGLLGMGASLTVTPGLLMAALSVVPVLVGRAIALVELLRLSSAYLLAPVLTNFALVYGTLLVGLQVMFWIVFGLLVGGIIFITLIYMASGTGIHPPGLDNFLERGKPALESPPIGNRRSSKSR